MFIRWSLTGCAFVGLTAFIISLTVINIDVVNAEPYIAVREGLQCSACHVNQTGMGKRNFYGVEYSQSDLPVMPTSSADSDVMLDRAITDFLSIGGNFRVTNFSTLPEVTTGTPPATTTTSTTNTFQFFEANVYAEVVVKQDRLTVYIDESVGPGGATNRELFAMIHGLPNGSWVKFGRLALPYGFRVWDSGFTRSQTNMLGQEVGVEFGIEPGAVSFQAAVTNGEPFRATDTNNGKQLTMRLSGVGSKGRFGGSFAINSEDPRFNGSGNKRTLVMGGPFFGFTGGPLTFLGEVDFIRSYGVTDYITRVVAYGEVNLLLTQGVNAKFAFDYLDPKNGAAPGKRYRIGIEPTITEYMQVRVFYDINRPRNFVDPLFGFNSNQDQLLAELHLFF